MKRSSFGLWVRVNPWVNLGEHFIRVNPTDVCLIQNKTASLGPQNGKWLKRASFIVFTFLSGSDGDHAQGEACVFI